MNKWPKIIPPPTPEEKRVNDDFMEYWHNVLPKTYGFADKFNHEYAVKNAPMEFLKTLEIGAGLGEHLDYEKLSLDQRKSYHSVELRANMVQQIRERYPDVNVVHGDCQKKLPFEDGYFDRILAIHVLEHLPDLPACIAEMYRLCNKDHGIFSVVIPCEGSLAYSLAREISAKRIFEKRYKVSYHQFISREHINLPWEIYEELKKHFKITHVSHYPLKIPFQFCNLFIGITLRPKTNL